MTRGIINNLSKYHKFDEVFQAIYQDKYSFEDIVRRYIELNDAQVKNFGVKPDFFVSSSGRVELLGNHTDHNGGLAFSATITMDCLGAISKNDHITVVKSSGYPAMTVNLEDLSLKPEEKGTSLAMLKGVLNYFKEHGRKIGGFVASLTTNVASGSGISSSAAFELLIAEAVNALYNDGQIDEVEKALAAQYSENVYFGKPSGLLDQATISIGGMILLDFKERICKYRRIEEVDDKVDILLVNTGDHSNLTKHYAEIKKEMLYVASRFGKDKLIDLPKEEFFARINELYSKNENTRALLRAIHFYNENERVERAYEQASKKDFDSLYDMMNLSGNSSASLLQNCYVPGDKSQPIMLAVELLRRQEGVKCARVHGGGFAGTVLALVKKSDTANVKAYMASVFGEKNVFVASIRSKGTCVVPFEVIYE